MSYLPEGFKAQEEFWDLYRRLGECYAAETAKLKKAAGVAAIDAWGGLSRSRKTDSQTSSLALFPSLPVKRLASPVCPPEAPQSMDTEDASEIADKKLTSSLASVSLPVARAYQPHSHWGQNRKKPPARRHSVKSMAVPKDEVDVDLNSAVQGASHRAAVFCRCAACFPLLPGGRLRYCWDLISIVFVLHDAMVLPLYFFGVQRLVAVQTLAWCARIFWLADLGVNMLTGYYEMGVLVEDLRKIFCRYVRTWLLLDAVCVAEDWTSLTRCMSTSEVDVQSEPARVFIGLVRVLRLFKLRKIGRQIVEQLQTQTASIQFNLLGTVTGLVIINHIMACCWYGISLLGESDETWIRDRGFTDADASFQYMASYYWAFAQLGVGSTEIQATNMLEYVFATCVAMFSLLIFSTLVSTMTSLMSTLNEIQEAEITQFRALRRFLSYNNIEQELSTRIVRFIQHSYPQKSQENLEDGDLAILDLLSSPLKAELRFARFEKNLGCLPFLQNLMSSDDLQVTRLTHKLAGHLDLVLVAPGDAVFFAENDAKACYMNLHGTLKYYQTSDPEEVPDDIWISEMCLWTPWEFLGTMVAEEVSRLVSMSEDHFKQTICESAVTKQMASSYAIQYVNDLTSRQVTSDLWMRSEPKAVPSVSVSVHATGVNPLLAVARRLSRNSLGSGQGAPSPRISPLVPSPDSSTS